MGSVGFDPSKYAHPLISERSIDEPRSLKVIYIGAGISGVDAAIQLPKYVPNIDLTIYEKNADVGGTWYENRYPGCACDIPAHSYQLSFESNVGWSRFYAGAPEILKYWQGVADKYNVRRFMKFKHKCLGARWDDNASKWNIELENMDNGEKFVDVADVFVTGCGILNEWKWPEIQGLKDFKGTLMHSAKYDQDFDATGKTVAILGAGSSGIQIVPTLQRVVKSMDHYVRGRTWIAASFGHELVRERNDGQDGNFTYQEEEKVKWRNDPEAYLKYRKSLEVGMQSSYAVTHRDTPEHIGARQLFDGEMRARLRKKPEIIEHLLPSFPPLCKRLTPGPGYLEALTASNVNVVPENISHIDATGIVTEDGRHRPVDAIICATGFNTSFQGRFPVIGRNSVNLQDRYAIRPETYLSIATDGFPNFFQSLGPNSGLGNGSLMIIIESIQLSIAQLLQKLTTGNVKILTPKASCVKNFTDYCDAYFKRTVFSAECGSWYKSSPPDTTPEEKKRGRISALWPGSSVHAVKALEKVRWEDWDIETLDGNDFGWFGDGWSVAERNMDAEGLSYYLNDTRYLHKSLEEENQERREREATLNKKGEINGNQVPVSVVAT